VERNTFKEFDPVYGKLLLNNYNDLGHTVSFTYDPVLGLPTGETDENGVKTSMEYDGFGRTTRIVQADGNWKNTRYERCKQGITVGCPTDAIFLVEETMANGRTERSYFDKMNREVQSVETGFGDRTIYTRNYFNERGQLVRTSQPFFANETPHWNGWVYDPIGREIAQTQDDIIVSTTHYEGKKIIYTNALGQTRTEEFSVNGRLQRTVDTEGNALEYTYDAQGNTILIQYPGSHAVQMTYDLFGRQTSLSDPDIGLYHYTYNLGGELIWEQDPMGQVTVFTYDTLGRPATRTDPEELTQFSYDNAPYAKGRLIEKVSRPPGSPTGLITSYTYGYDALSRPTSTAMRFNSDAQTYTLGIRYDHIGRDSVLLYPGAQGSAASLRMVYDAQGFHVEGAQSVQRKSILASRQP
jgi:YD repeat-containing protein